MSSDFSLTHIIYSDGSLREVLVSQNYAALRDRKSVVLSGAGPTSIAARRIINTLSLDAPLNVMTTKDSKGISSLESVLKRNNVEVLYAVGGGSVIDLSKVLASRLGLPLVLFPTTLSNDAICSPVARYDGNSIMVDHPKLVVFEMDVLSNAPARLLLSGIGDLVSNVTACIDWLIADLLMENKDDKVNESACAHALGAVKFFISESRDLDLEKDKRSLSYLLAEAHIKSGLAMSTAGSSRPCSGAEHLISHAIDQLFPGQATHGEQVSVGTYFSAQLQKDFIQSQWGRGSNKFQALDFVDDYFEAFPLPRNCDSIGLMTDAFRRAVMLAPTIRNRPTILNFGRVTDFLEGLA